MKIGDLSSSFLVVKVVLLLMAVAGVIMVFWEDNSLAAVKPEEDCVLRKDINGAEGGTIPGNSIDTNARTTASPGFIHQHQEEGMNSSIFSSTIVEILELDLIEESFHFADKMVDSMPKELHEEIVRVQFADNLSNIHEKLKRSKGSNAHVKDADFSLRIIVSGGSPSTFKGISYQYPLSRRLVEAGYPEPITFQRAHGNRNLFHTMQLMHSFYPAEEVDLILWEFSLNDRTSFKTAENQSQLLALYLRQLQEFYKNQKLPVPKVLFVGLSLKRDDGIGSFGIAENLYLDVVQEVCGCFPDICIGIVHIPHLYKSISDEENTMKFFFQDNYHPSHRTHNIIAKLIFDLLHQPRLQDNNMALPTQAGCSTTTKVFLDRNSTVGLSPLEVLLVNHRPIASFTAEKPKNTIDYTTPDSSSSQSTLPPDMLEPTNSSSLLWIPVGKASAGRIDRKFKIPIPICALANETAGALATRLSIDVQRATTSSSSKRQALTGIQFAGIGEGFNTKDLLIERRSASSTSWRPLNYVVSKPPESPWSYSRMGLVDVYVASMIHAPLILDHISICAREPTKPAMLAQVVLYTW